MRGRFFKQLALAAALFVASPAWAATPTIFVDTAGNGGVNTDSGSTNTASSALATCTGATAWLITTGCAGTAATWATGVGAITLDTNTNLSTLPVDGSQAIFLTNATNTDQKVFWITSITGCTGTGACVVNTGVAPTCATCTAQNWAIGGRVTLPDTSIENTLVAGNILSINSSIACGAAICFTMRGAGNDTAGPIMIQPTTTAVTLSNTGNNIVLSSSGTPVNWHITGPITLSNAASSTSVLLSTGGTGTIVTNLTFTEGASATGACANVSGSVFTLLDSTFTACGGDAFTDNQATAINIIGNYFSGTFGGNGLTISGVNPQAFIYNNLMIGNTSGVASKIAISVSGTSTSFANSVQVLGNTIADWYEGGLNVAGAFTSVKMFNNIFYNNNLGGTSTYYNVTMPSSTPADTMAATGAHGCNDFFTTGGTFNLSNVVANATEITTNPDFVSAGSNWSLNTSTPSLAINAGCYQNIGAYATAKNYVSMGALQLNGSGASSPTAAGLIGGGM